MNNCLLLCFKNLFCANIYLADDENENKDLLKSNTAGPNINTSNQNCVLEKVVDDCLAVPQGSRPKSNIAEPYINTLEIIHSSINPKILKKISNNQQYAYNIDKTGMENVECYICFEENINLVTIKCTHSLCIKCYNKLLEQNYLNCPICRQKMVIITVHKLYVIFTQINHIGIGILYLPPIYIEDEKIWKDHEIFSDILHDTKQIANFISVCERINLEKYVIVLPNKQVKKFFESFHSRNKSKTKFKFDVLLINNN